MTASRAAQQPLDQSVVLLATVDTLPWPYEILGFLFRERRTAQGPTLEEFWGAPQDAEEESMLPRPAASPALCTIEPLPATVAERRGSHPAPVSAGAVPPARSRATS